MKDSVFVPSKIHFQGLFGIFADSLLDAWGQLLLERLLKKKKIDGLNVINRLAIVGDSGKGALEYKPDMKFLTDVQIQNLDFLANECKKILETEYSNQIDQLYLLGGTSGGAIPKILTEIDGKEFIIKFPSHVDQNNIGLMEYDYSICAKKCGIDIPYTKLFSSNQCKGYFGIERFDRVNGKKIHMATVAALLELDYRQPNLDYNTLMKLTNILTHDNVSEIEQMYRRMCFNVFAHNQDDHSKNFSFLFDEKKRIWKLSPAYDLTYSHTYYGEHTTTVDGNGVNPGIHELISVGQKAGLSKKSCLTIAKEIEEKVNLDLKKYLIK